MNQPDIKTSIDRRLAGLAMDAKLEARVMAACRPAPRRRHPHLKTAVRRTVAAAAAFAVVFTGTIIATSSNPPLRDSLAALGNDLVMMLQPVNLQVENNGIRMEVVAAMNDEEVAVVYLTLQDTDKKGRVDDTTELYDVAVKGIGPLNQEGPGDAFSSAETLWYDENTQTATLRLTSYAAEQYNGKKITLDLRSFLSGHAYETQVDSGYTLADVAKANPLPQLLYPKNISSYTCWGNRGEDLARLLQAQKLPTLDPGGMKLSFEEYPWVTVCNAAIVDNMLHVQLKPDDEMGRYNTCSIQLGDAKGHVYDVSGARVELGEAVEEGIHTFYERSEQVLLLPGDVLYGDVHLYADISTYEHHVEGDWSTTFTLEKAAELREAACRIDMNPWVIERIAVSPIGITLYGRGEMYAYSKALEVAVYLNDGTEVSTRSASTSCDSEAIINKLIFNEPVHVEDVGYVLVNGEKIAF